MAGTEKRTRKELIGAASPESLPTLNGNVRWRTSSQIAGHKSVNTRRPVVTPLHPGKKNPGRPFLELPGMFGGLLVI